MRKSVVVVAVLILSFVILFGCTMRTLDAGCPNGEVSLDGRCIQDLENDAPSQADEQVISTEDTTLRRQDGNQQITSATHGVRRTYDWNKNYPVDLDNDRRVSASEAARITAYHRAGAHHCNDEGVDGYAPGIGNHNCGAHISDLDLDWTIAEWELDVVLAIWRADSYYYSKETRNFEPASKDETFSIAVWANSFFLNLYQNDDYYASDLLEDIKYAEDLEGQALLELDEFKELEIKIVSPLYSNFDGQRITARNRNGLFELDPERLLESYEGKFWADPRVLSDGSRYTPLPEDFFSSYGEYVRHIFEHEACHSIVFREQGETIADYEMRMDDVCTFPAAKKYKRLCSLVRYQSGVKDGILPEYTFFTTESFDAYFSNYFYHISDNFKIIPGTQLDVFCENRDLYPLVVQTS